MDRESEIEFYLIWENSCSDAQRQDCDSLQSCSYPSMWLQLIAQVFWLCIKYKTKQKMYAHLGHPVGSEISSPHSSTSRTLLHCTVSESGKLVQNTREWQRHWYWLVLNWQESLVAKLFGQPYFLQVLHFGNDWPYTMYKWWWFISFCLSSLLIKFYQWHWSATNWQDSWWQKIPLCQVPSVALIGHKLARQFGG